jgi:hypothetical protein
MQNDKPTMAEIRAAILANRGGHQQSTDDQLMTLWRSLPQEVQQQYLGERDNA